MTARQQKDSHALGILALSWNLLVTSLPAKVSTLCIEAINEVGLPSMTVKGNNLGEFLACIFCAIVGIHILYLDSGYTLDLSDGSICFSTAE
jgi:hypothetical protein